MFYLLRLWYNKNMSTTKRASKKSGRASSAKSARTTRSKKSTKACAAPSRFFCFITTVIIGAAATIFVTLLTMFALAGNITYQNAHSDAKRFASEYTTVSADNPFVYKTASEVIDIIEHGTGVVFLGFPSCPWCQSYAGYLNEVAKDTGLSTISYYNIYDARQDNTEDYQKLGSRSSMTKTATAVSTCQIPSL